MQKPSGYDEAKTGGDFTPVALGGHFASIIQVTERQSSTGKDMIVVLFDFTTADPQSGYFSDQYKNDTRNEKKWPFNGTKYIMVNDYNDPSKTSRAFKQFCTSAEKSNNGFTVQWGGANWGQQFKGKMIGVVFGEEEHEYEGKVSMRHVPKWFCAYDSADTARIPEPRYLNGQGPSAVAPSNNNGLSGFVAVPEGMDDEIPF